MKSLLLALALTLTACGSDQMHGFNVTDLGAVSNNTDKKASDQVDEVVDNTTDNNTDASDEGQKDEGKEDAGKIIVPANNANADSVNDSNSNNNENESTTMKLYSGYQNPSNRGTVIGEVVKEGNIYYLKEYNNKLQLPITFTENASGEVLSTNAKVTFTDSSENIDTQIIFNNPTCKNNYPSGEESFLTDVQGVTVQAANFQKLEKADDEGHYRWFTTIYSEPAKADQNSYKKLANGTCAKFANGTTYYPVEFIIVDFSHQLNLNLVNGKMVSQNLTLVKN